jgi:ADP-ribosylglycohydrolase
MIGAIAGDIIGSVYEHESTKDKHFELFPPGSRFTDDTVLTVAVASWLLTDEGWSSFRLARLLADFYEMYPRVGFGGGFRAWAKSGSRRPYGSYGNGSAMRVSPVAWVTDRYERATFLAERSAAVTHNHPEGIRGAMATAAAVYIARTGGTKSDIKRCCSAPPIGYNLDRSLEEIREGYSFEVSCQRSVPEAITCVLEAESFEDAVRNAVSLGGDADTQACIAGAIAEGLWGVPEEIATRAMSYLDPYLESVVTDFIGTFVSPAPCTCREPVKP